MGAGGVLDKAQLLTLACPRESPCEGAETFGKQQVRLVVQMQALRLIVTGLAAQIPKDMVGLIRLQAG